MTVARRLRVHGRVQGVGFRVFVAREARSLGVGGWVRNRLDGTVEAVVAGDDAAVQTLIENVRMGPRYGRVERLDVADEILAGDVADDFRILGDR